jgi:hypothetical protein
MAKLTKTELYGSVAFRNRVAMGLVKVAQEKQTELEGSINENSTEEDVKRLAFAYKILDDPFSPETDRVAIMIVVAYDLSGDIADNIDDFPAEKYIQDSFDKIARVGRKSLSGIRPTTQ